MPVSAKVTLAIERDLEDVGTFLYEDLVVYATSDLGSLTVFWILWTESVSV